MPDIVFAVNDNSLARAIPIYFGNLCVSPHEGLKPRIAWVSPNLASFAIYIRSADNANSSPPVKQKPFIFDITALGESSSNLITSLACLSNSLPTPPLDTSVPFASSCLRSTPAENAFPAPESIITLIASLLLIVIYSSFSSCKRSTVIAFILTGLLRVISAILSFI